MYDFVLSFNQLVFPYTQKKLLLDNKNSVGTSLSFILIFAPNYIVYKFFINLNDRTDLQTLPPKFEMTDSSDLKKYDNIFYSIRVLFILFVRYI